MSLVADYASSGDDGTSSGDEQQQPAGKRAAGKQLAGKAASKRKRKRTFFLPPEIQAALEGNIRDEDDEDWAPPRAAAKPRKPANAASAGQGAGGLSGLLSLLPEARHGGGAKHAQENALKTQTIKDVQTKAGKSPTAIAPAHTAASDPTADPTAEPGPNPARPASPDAQKCICR